MYRDRVVIASYQRPDSTRINHLILLSQKENITKHKTQTRYVYVLALYRFNKELQARKYLLLLAARSRFRQQV
ncbi:hypothetical protein XELAEV_18002036mg [Xenopus laevis]|uniref:Uncharacterized protein n=1 Tax=Xenopus laevis TaxID=8355 RepID=A0A974GYN0_XENLA|nr:hypothetical protein XELAEV_18002036mg [Xenopus laevis]